MAEGKAGVCHLSPRLLKLNEAKLFVFKGSEEGQGGGLAACATLNSLCTEAELGRPIPSSRFLLLSVAILHFDRLL